MKTHALFKLTATELKLYSRDWAAIFWTFLFWIFLIVLFVPIFEHGPDPFYGGINYLPKYVDWLAPGFIAGMILSISVNALGPNVTRYRENGILKRFKVTPLESWVVITAQILLHYILIILTATLIVLLCIVPFKAHVLDPIGWLRLLIVVTIGSMSFLSMGFLIASITKNTKTAEAIGMALFFPMWFLSDAAMPLAIMPEGIQTVSKFMPLTYLTHPLRNVWYSGILGSNWVDLLVLIALAAICFVVSSKMFKWE